MRRILTGLALMLAALPARAQTPQTYAAQCAGSNRDLAIDGCTALIQIKNQTYKLLVFAYGNRAWAYHLKGEDAKGLRDADMALQLEPENADVLETRAEIHEKLGQRDKAIADYRAALKIDPAMKQAQDGLGRLHAAP
jgi:tetratricopeptide (TPR) repeat protein